MSSNPLSDAGQRFSDERLSPLEAALVSEIRAARKETRETLGQVAQAVNRIPDWRAVAAILTLFFGLLVYQTSLIAQLAGQDPRVSAEATRTVVGVGP